MEYIKADDVKLFFCYSVPLMQFLTKQNNMEYLVVGLNQNNNKKFWAFLRCDKLHQALEQWQDDNN